jgi:S-formylglutathione hydrolase FrmB
MLYAAGSERVVIVALSGRYARGAHRSRSYRARMAALAAAVAAALVLPGFKPVASGPDGGAVLAGRFPGTARVGYVYLPPSFSPVVRYPVVYLLHGMPGSPSEYLYGANVVDFADHAIAAGAVRPFVAVIPAAGTKRGYDGEWAGPWERALVDRVVPWVDAHLPTEPTAAGRILAGLSAGGYGAADIGLRNPDVFGTVEAWSGYFTPLRDGPFRGATAEVLAANDPTRLAVGDARELRRVGIRFFLSTGPAHSHWFGPEETFAFAAELRSLGVRVDLRLFSSRSGEWRDQVAAGLAWALAR